MNKAIIAVGALVVAVAATPAFAQSWGYGGGYGYYGSPGSYRDYVRQMRACQQHDRLHRELDAEHAQEHAEGLYGRGDHRDLHDDLERAHEAYHEDHPRSDICDQPAYAPPPVAPYGYSYAPPAWTYPDYGPQFSLRFGYGW